LLCVSLDQPIRYQLYVFSVTKMVKYVYIATYVKTI